ncbi:MAG TPA: TSUP family transporter [Polyangia bacterium]|nr:TSUP family transporter [Polyangia bacterium]
MTLTPIDVSVPLLMAQIAAAFAAGLVDAIGGGGGLVSLPALLAAGLPAPIAIATNKGQAIFGATSSFVAFWRRDGIDRARAPLGFVCGFAGAGLGALALMAMRPEPLRPLVIALLLVAAVVVLFGRARLSATRTAGGPRGARGALALAAIALGLGAYDGFFGPGTGSMLIIAFALCFGDSLTRASGNAKVVNLASNLAAFALFAARGTILWRIALPMAAANVVGAALGARVALARGDRLVRVVVVVMVTAVAIKLSLDIAR